MRNFRTKNESEIHFNLPLDRHSDQDRPTEEPKKEKTTFSLKRMLGSICLIAFLFITSQLLLLVFLNPFGPWIFYQLHLFEVFEVFQQVLDFW